MLVVVDPGRSVGHLLTLLMEQGDDRSVANVLFGAFGAVSNDPASTASRFGHTVRQHDTGRHGIALAYARSV